VPKAKKKKSVGLMKPRYWFCTIGPVPEKDIPFGGDFPPRMAVKDAICKITGHSPDCASGWCDEGEAEAMRDARHKWYKQKELDNGR